MEDGEWRMENGEWRMEDGRWRMEDEGWIIVFKSRRDDIIIDEQDSL